MKPKRFQRTLGKSAAAAFLAMICGLETAGFSAFAQPSPPPARRPISYVDIPSEFCEWLNKQGIDRHNFKARMAAIELQTGKRERDGEFDHLIFFLLQSTRFTDQPKIEPALSAEAFIKALSDAERASYLSADYLPPIERMPGQARARLKDFIKAVDRRPQDERLTFFKTLLAREVSYRSPVVGSQERFLFAEYARAMRFLYEKEFVSRALKQENLATHIDELYQKRGHSTDTQIEANFAVSIALSALKAETPGLQLNRVLIVGPGLDFAPRTDLLELFGPQSYQPFAVADALLSLRLSNEEKMQIHCIDINERVIAYLKSLRKDRDLRLSLLSGVREVPGRPLTEDFKSYFRGFGKAIGNEFPLDVPSGLTSHLGKGLKVHPEIVARVTADRLNLITERYEPSPAYDLVIVTNVFPYFNQTELLFALINITKMMAEGGYLIHNELQTVPQTVVNRLGLPMQQARTVLIAPGGDFPLYDGVAIHRKKK
jgi:hypothetical protein